MAVLTFRPGKAPSPGNAPHEFDGVRVLPGKHNYPEAIYAKLQAHPDFQAYLDAGAITVSLETPDKAKVDPNATHPENLAGFNVEQAEEVIDGCHDLATLQRWLAVESRVTVRRALNRRITQIQDGQE